MSTGFMYFKIMQGVEKHAKCDQRHKSAGVKSVYCMIAYWVIDLYTPVESYISALYTPYF